MLRQAAGQARVPTAVGVLPADVLAKVFPQAVQLAGDAYAVCVVTPSGAVALAYTAAAAMPIAGPQAAAKAYTAVQMGTASNTWPDGFDPLKTGIAGLCGYRGSAAIIADGVYYGCIGASGGAPESDEELAATLADAIAVELAC